MIRRLLGFVASLGLAAFAAAGPQTYAKRTQDIHVGVVVLDADKSASLPVTESAAPYAWFNLERQSKLKPAGWTFSNPLAAGTLTGTAAARWDSLTGQTIDGRVLTKQNAPYWEVSLSQISDSDVGQFDVLLVAPQSYVSLNPIERERLRRFVDQGGILWIDTGALGSSSVDAVNNFPISFVTAIQGGAVQADYSQPLLNLPNALGSRDVALLTDTSHGARANVMNPATVTGSLGSLYPTFSATDSTKNEFHNYQPVIYGGGQPIMAEAKIGDGFVVVTARGAALKLSGTTVGDANRGFTAEDPSLDADGVSAARLAINIVSLASDFRQSSGESRKSNSSFVTVRAPLMQQFTLPINTQGAAPVLYKGVLLATSGTKLYAYDAKPSSDLDLDGNTDDGWRDYSNGTSYDELWEVDLGSQVSAPVCAEVPNATSSGSSRDQVFVVAGSTLYAFNVFNLQNGVIAQNNAAPSPIWSRSVGSSSFAPTVQENTVYVASNTSGKGQIFAFNAQTGTPVTDASNKQYELDSTYDDVTLPLFSASPTVGYIPILDNSGGVDKVLYAPTQPQTGATAVPAGIISIWIGARGEKPVSADVQASAVVLQTRASQQGGLPVDMNTVRLTVMDANGNVWGANTMSQYFGNSTPTDAGGGSINFPTSQTLPAGVTFRIDYDIDWSGGTASTGVLQSVVRGQIDLPDNPNNHRVILGPIAMSSQGTIYAVTSEPLAGVPGASAGDQQNVGGSFFAFREEGRGQFTCVTRYDLYNAHNITLNQVGASAYPEVLFDKDHILDSVMGGALSWGGGARFSNFTFTGGPSVRNGRVFVTAQAYKMGGYVPFTILMAFNAEPSTPQMVIPNLPDNTVLAQEDMLKSTSVSVGATPETQSVLQNGAYTYDSATGTLRIDNLMNVTKGPIQNCLSLSEPLIIRKPGSPDELVEPNAVAGSTWSPLLWYTVLPGTQSQAAPLVLGNTVYVAGASLVPAIMNGTYTGGRAPAPTDLTSVIAAFDADVPTNDTALQTTYNVGGDGTLTRTWQPQLVTMNYAGQFDAHQVWPQLSGAANLSDYVIRLNQTALSGSNDVFGVAGGDGTLVAWSSAGVYSFDQANTVVCDEGRVAIFDASGNAVYTSNAFANTGENGESGAGTVKPLVRPTRAYPLGNSQLLIVDTGASRIAVANLSGTESRSITGFRIDPTYIPDGYSSNESTDLKAPRDVAEYEGYVALGNQPLVTGQQALEYWKHYIVADSGNHRLIELVDRYSVDPTSRRVLNPITVNGVPQLGILLWHSPTSVSGNGFEYNSISRVYIPGASATSGRYVYVAGVGGSLPAKASVGLDTAPSAAAPSPSRVGNGGVVVFDPVNPGGAQVINQIEVPDSSGTLYWNATANQYQAATDPVLKARRQRHIQYLSDVNSATARMTPYGLAIMVADADGVYEFTLPSPAATVGQVDWMIPNEAYQSLRRANNTTSSPLATNAPLRATYARRLDSGDVMIVNGYSGNRLGGDAITGEVVELDGTSYLLAAPNLGFSIQSIRFELNPIQGARGLILPLYADRR